MKWTFDTPEAGDMVRVRVGSIYHYGIFVSDEEIIQFGPPPSDVRRLASGEDIRVISTDADGFRSGGFIETGRPGFSERVRARRRAAVVAYARSQLGRGGYDILRNNCEHFARECLFGKGECAVVDKARIAARAMPSADVYLSEVSGSETTRVYPPDRESEIKSARNAAVAAQKRTAWRLLCVAMKNSMGIEPEKAEFRRTENGKWLCDKCMFSLTHTAGYAAAAVSRFPVGVDMEEYSRTRDLRKLYGKIVCPEERLVYGEDPSDTDVLRLWTRKESIFKRYGDGGFEPLSVNTEKETAVTRIPVKYPLVISVSAERLAYFSIYEVSADGKVISPLAGRNA